MEIKQIRIGNRKVMPFTIPSGIITTSAQSLEKIAKEVPELGILTTKSIGPVARQGYKEPILHQYSPGCWVNAVGLTNPGCEEFARELSQIHLPGNKALISSIYGANIDEFIFVAKTLAPYSNAVEVNVSCPHVKGHGMQLGQDPEFVNKLTRQLKEAISIPVFVKLPPIPNIVESANAAVSGGADGLVMINTERGYSYILSNGNCGISGIAIKPLGIRCVRDVREAVGKNVLMIGMGGISSARDIEDYKNAGANAFGIGSALAGMDSEKIKEFFKSIVMDIEDGTNISGGFLKKVYTDYKEVRIEEIVNSYCDFKIFRTNIDIAARPGQFVFAYIPGFGEKPFSIMNDNPLTLGVLERGLFTKQFISLKQGDFFYFRGPYGNGIKIPKGSNTVLVGGGCGIAGLYLPAKRFFKEGSVMSLFGAKDKEHLPYLGEFKKYSDVKIATEDGSLGKKGLVTDLFSNADIKKESYFFNCGPRAMVDAVLPLELSVSSVDRIFSSVDYMTRCGVGICGSCADEKGRRTCVEGPFMRS